MTTASANPPPPRRRERRRIVASNAWRPKDVNALIAVATFCLCITFVTVVVTIGVVMHRIDLATMGTWTKAGAGTGFLGMLGILVYGMRKSLC